MVYLSPSHKSLSVLPRLLFFFFFLAQWVMWKWATSLHPSCVRIMSLCLWGTDSNGLVITVCLRVYRCIPPPCLHGLWAKTDKDHTFIFAPSSSEDRVSSHCELPLWSYYKAQYFWSELVWVQGMNLTWLCNLEIHEIYHFSLWCGAKSCEKKKKWGKKKNKTQIQTNSLL